MATESSEETTDLETERESTASGLDPNVAGALSYLLGPITGILFYVLEPDDEFIRFHAAQSTIVFGGLFVVSVVLSVVMTVLAFVPVIGWIFGALVGLVSLVVSLVGVVAWLFLMYKAYSGAMYEVPFVAPHAHRYAET
ncbi:MAG: DUF4870 domain-containing protein [Halobacteriota archaeon]|uniref:DUF4870 domain-containing protein n=1 Tax=Natronomonas sp. TaxID=2184060 RepID=UPI003976B9A4